MNRYIQLKNVNFQYPGTSRKQVSGVSLNIRQYQITTLVGRVGSGKSSILQLINGINKIQGGTISIDGKPVTDKSKINFRDIGFLFENPDQQIFYPVVADDIAFGPRNLGLRRGEINRRVVDAAEDVGILHLLERETSSLSMGEKTLVALAGVLAMKPKILLLDSPGVGLDMWTKTHVCNLLREHTATQTIVIASNDSEFLRIADRIYLMHDGKLVGQHKNYSNFRKSLAKRTDVLFHEGE